MNGTENKEAKEAVEKVVAEVTAEVSKPIPTVIKNIKDVDLKQLKENYGQLYQVTVSLNVDGGFVPTDIDLYFKKPTSTSFSRYISTLSKNSMQAMENLIVDNIVEEQREAYAHVIGEYPAMSLGVGEKLLSILGLPKDTNFKKL
jgi:hypothetical protein